RCNHTAAVDRHDGCLWLRDTRRDSVPPENDRCEPAGGDGHYCRGEAVEHAVVPRSGGDDLAAAWFVDLEWWGGVREPRAVHETPDSRHLGANPNHRLACERSGAQTPGGVRPARRPLRA